MSHAKIRKEERWGLKLLMGVLCAVHPWVVKATRPNICDEEHTIMNNAHYGTAAQRVHGPVSSLQTFSDVQWVIIQFVCVPSPYVAAVV